MKFYRTSALSSLFFFIFILSSVMAFAIEESKEPSKGKRVIPPSGAVIQVPSQFKTKSYVCDTIEKRRSSGLTLENALISFIQSYQSNDPVLLQSTRSTIFSKALSCPYDATVVMAAYYKAGVSPELIVFAALDAGVSAFEIKNLLTRLGVEPQTVADAIGKARKPVRVDLTLPPGYGLGPATPFIP
jgi:hypothetical protein